MKEQKRGDITNETADQAAHISIGFHANAFVPTEVCLGSDLLPWKTILEGSQFLGQCSKCLSVFVFNVYTMEWIQ